ncbi:hypothetical protein FRB90_011191 [Tulasnella sp. 427]|nr:hypothetical protein FRB90_011191 [Tulasnella sp. 427]
MNPASASGSGGTLQVVASFNEPVDDPGLRLELKRSYSGQECFDKLPPYLHWLRTWIDRNRTLATQDMIDRLWNAWKDGESELGNVTVVREFFTQKAHRQVMALWERYRDLRRDMENAATDRVIFIALRAGEEIATAMDQAVPTTEVTIQVNTDGPEGRESATQKTDS